MKYSINLIKIDRVYSFTIYNYDGIVETCSFVSVKSDENYCAHVLLQRALRRAIELKGIPNLAITFDTSLLDSIGYELAGIIAVKNKALNEVTQRLLNRFESYKFGASNFSDREASITEVAALDEALNKLDELKTVKGKWRLLCDRFFNTKNTIIR